MSWDVYVQVALQALVISGAFYSTFGCLLIAHTEYQEGRQGSAFAWSWLSFFGAGIIFAAGPFLRDSIPSVDALIYLAHGREFNTFSVARYCWIVATLGTLYSVWKYKNEACWFGLLASSSIAFFCLWVLWLVWELHG